MSEPGLEKDCVNIEAAIEDCGSIVWNGKGVSMRPLIRDGVDYAVIERADREIKPYDVVLYARDAQAGDAEPSKRDYVLHRVIKKDGDTYIILGDNCVSYEYVPEDKIIGVMSGLIRNGKSYDFNSAMYKAYMRLWIKPVKLRIILTRARNKAKRAGIKAIKGVGRIGRQSTDN